jgi:Predicted phosphatases
MIRIMKENTQYKLAIFDLDGTLLDTTEGILLSVKVAIEKMQWKQLDDNVLKSFIGPPLQELFIKHFNANEKNAKIAVDIFRSQYENKHLLKAIPYEGIFEVLELLQKKNIRIAVATYKPEKYAKTILHNLGFEQYVEFLYGADFENKLKKADMMKKIISDAGIDSYEEVVMIGDSSHDALASEELLVDFIGVLYGFGFKSPDSLLKYSNIGYAIQPTELVEFIIAHGNI